MWIDVCMCPVCSLWDEQPVGVLVVDLSFHSFCSWCSWSRAQLHPFYCVQINASRSRRGFCRLEEMCEEKKWVRIEFECLTYCKLVCCGHEMSVRGEIRISPINIETKDG